MYKKHQKVIYEFPKGTAKQVATFVRYSSEKQEKVQLRTPPKGRLFWFPADCIVGPNEEKKEDSVSDIDTASAEAQAKLDQIKSRKKAKNKLSKKTTIRTQVEELILKGNSNKEILEEIDCAVSYPTTIREKMFNEGKIDEELLHTRHNRGYKKPDKKFMQSVGESVVVLDNLGSEFEGIVIEPKNKIGNRRQITVQFIGPDSVEYVAVFSRKTGEELYDDEQFFHLKG